MFVVSSWILLVSLLLTGGESVMFGARENKLPSRPELFGGPLAKQPKITNVRAGAQTFEDDFMLMGMSFYPNIVRVQRGDVVRFTIESHEPHTITFGAGNDLALTAYPPIFPYLAPTPKPPTSPIFNGLDVVNSAFLTQGSEYEVKIDAPPGVYRYRCILHPMMFGYVQVVDKKPLGRQLTSSIENARRGEREMAADLELASLLLAQARTYVSQPSTALFPTDPSPPAVVVVDGIGNGRAALYEFVPKVLTVALGTRVRFVNHDPFAPHTVTFGPVNPASASTFFQLPYGIPTGTDAWLGEPLNSGWLYPENPANKNNVAFFDLTFGKAGTFSIYCALHEEVGMVMTVIVQ